MIEQHPTLTAQQIRQRYGWAEIDPAVGLRWLRRLGDEVQAGDALLEGFYRDGSGLAAAEARLGRVVEFDTGREIQPLVLGRLDS